MERVWDYPLPPALVPCERRVRIVVDGVEIVSSGAALRVLETSHPPTIYVPPGDILAGVLQPSSARGTWCEWKGAASYLDVVVGARRIPAAAWTYPEPVAAYAALRDFVSFYPGRMDEAWLGDERVEAQEGDFYGGWRTSDLVGPFKGAPGTLGW